MHIKKIFYPSHFLDFQKKAICWAERFRNFQYLNGNELPYLHSSFPVLLAVSDQHSFALSFPARLTELLRDKDWWFGYLGYGYGQPPYHSDFLGFEEGEFFKPDSMLTFHSNAIEIQSVDSPEAIYQEIEAVQLVGKPSRAVKFAAQHSKEEYVQKVEQIKSHLRRGNVYQVNFCTRFDAENAKIAVVEVYEKLNSLSPMPFSSLLKVGDKYIICASPERYLKKIGTEVVSQPIKGTSPRGKGDKEDMANIDYLQNSPKERAENVMIVDLVRNDLSQVCIPGSVKVEKLCEVRTFQSLHQMISTVVGEVPSDCLPEQLINATFPMGSMTGAPKIRAMELIQEFEKQERGPFSGALGYFSPNGDFDFNVLIRSVFYNARSQQLSFSVGSGITVLSDPEAEYEECLLKASAIAQVLGS